MHARTQSLAPLVETERLLLTAHRLDDLDACVAMWSDPQVTRYIGGRPFTAEETWAKLLRAIGHWSLLGFGYWVVREKASERFVGEVGLADFRRDIEPSIAGIPEVGWALAPWSYGQGYATEAVAAALAWAATHLDAERTVCLIDPGNRASVRVAEKNGYRERVRTQYQNLPTILFERSNES